MSFRRLATSLPVGVTLLLAAASPSWAAGEPGTFQSWLVDHRGPLWTVFYIQLALIVALGAWEAAFQMHRRRAPGVTAPAAPTDATEPIGLVDPFKTQITARRSPSTPIESSTLRRSRSTPATEGDDRPPAAPPLLPPSEETPTVRGARRLERIDSADATEAVRRPPVPPSGTPPTEAGADSWADALRRTTQTPERPHRRPVQLPPPVARGPGRPEVPLRPLDTPAEPSAPAEPPAPVPPRPVVRTVKSGGFDAPTVPVAMPPASPPPVAPVAPAAIGPVVPVMVAGGGVRMPAGFTRYAWDHALRLLGGALVDACRMSPGAAGTGAVTAGSATLNLVTPPPAAAQKSRGRGMKLAAGGETRVGETYGRATPMRALDASAVEGPVFSDVVRNAPPPPVTLQPMKRMGEECAMAPEDVRIAPPPRPAAPSPSPAAPSPFAGAPPAAPPVLRPVVSPPAVTPTAPAASPSVVAPPSAAPVLRPAAASPLATPASGGPPPTLTGASSAEGPSRLPGTPAPGAPTLATPGMARRALDLPSRRLDIAKSTEARTDAPSSDPGASTSPSGAPAGPADAARTPIQKENPPPLRKSEGGQRYLEIPKISRERNDDPNADPNKP